MDNVSLLVTIVSRKATKRFVDFYRQQGLQVAHITMGKGTASNEFMDYFGLDGAEKSLIFHVISHADWKEVKKQLRLQMRIDFMGGGIAFLVPLSSIGGQRALDYLSAGRKIAAGEETVLKETKFELLVAIANQGYSQQIMDAARKHRAGGGTVIHARGTGTELADTFMGVTLVPEKEMVFIVTRKEQKNAIMSSIMQEVGIDSEAGTIVFSLPVTDTAGMRMMEDDDFDA
ncbi:MAG: P-II family nitrogen regulator [Firmicutes bacterium]|nr:P-II family nitrogen regulator [Bacillota bacterium]